MEGYSLFLSSHSFTLPGPCSSLSTAPWQISQRTPDCPSSPRPVPPCPQANSTFAAPLCIITQTPSCSLPEELGKEGGKLPDPLLGRRGSAEGRSSPGQTQAVFPDRSAWGSASRHKGATMCRQHDTAVPWGKADSGNQGIAWLYLHLQSGQGRKAGSWCAIEVREWLLSFAQWWETATVIQGGDRNPFTPPTPRSFLCSPLKEHEILEHQCLRSHLIRVLSPQINVKSIPSRCFFIPAFKSSEGGGIYHPSCLDYT